MSLQIRITNNDGSDPIILDQATDITYTKSVNSSDEGITFTVAKNSPKADVVNPDTEGYKRFWEVWDTATNARLNKGPLTSIEEAGTEWKVQGQGRSALLNDAISSKKTYYTAVDSILNDLLFENIAIQPRASTFVAELPNTGDSLKIFGTIGEDSKYAGLSRQTKDNVIDDNTGYIKPGTLEPVNTHYNTDSYWTGMSISDAHVVDLGDTYNISYLTVRLPWWGGPSINSNRSYDWSMSYAPDLTAGDIYWRGRWFNDPAWTNIYTSPSPNQLGGGGIYYLGEFGRNTELPTTSGAGFYTLTGEEGPIPMRYIRTKITDVRAWYGNALEGITVQDGYDFECNPNYVTGSFAPSLIGSNTEGYMKGKVISDQIVEPQNDCHAGIVEIGAFQQLLTRDVIKPLVLQRIDNNNLQITYHHIPQSTDTVTTGDGFRKFEPGSLFRKFWVTWTGASATYTKFFSSDCANCFPDGFSFGIMDQNNNLIYASDNSTGTDVSLKAPAETRMIHMKGSNDAHVTWVDAWPAITDPLSWGGSYSYTEMANDYAIVHFRGQSFIWYATIPEDKTGAHVKLEIRSKTDTGTFGAWSTLVADMQLDSNLSNYPVYNISYESGTLQADIVYEIKITNLDGGYCSIDSIEGFWSGSLTQYNEDSHRVIIRQLENVTQIYDKKFSNGSMYKTNKRAQWSFAFTGDRVILYSAKGRHHGKIRIALSDVSVAANNLYGNPNTRKVDIPGADAQGNLRIDLDTGKRGNEIPQYVVFDSNDYFPNGLPWSRYGITLYYAAADVEQYVTTDIAALDSFVARCQDCTPKTGATVSIGKPIFLDGVAAHEIVGLSVQFENDTHLDILKSVVEATQVEWDITEQGLRVEPRIGQDTNEVLREGQNTVVNYSVVNDITQIASMLVSTGADIDGLPLYTITEDKSTRENLGRTIVRKEDFRDSSDYFQLVGLSRTSLRKRKIPQKRIQVTHSAKSLNLDHGDSFILYTKKMGPIRVRIDKKTRSESSGGGTTFNLECEKWPQII